ncbi:MAG: hypothetical protein ACYC67_26250 [Prosthecobacter sp.]
MLVAMSLFAFIACSPDESHAKDGGPAGHSHFTEIPATTDGIWKLLGEQQAKLGSVVAKNELGEAHDHGYAIRDLVRALPAKVSAEKKVKAEAAAVEVAKIAAAIDKSSAAGAQKATQANVEKMAAAVTALKTELKAK